MPRGQFERTPQWKKKLSEAKKGKPSGKPKDPKQEQLRIERIIETKKKNGTLKPIHKDPIARNKKISNANKGKTRTQQVKDKMSLTRKGKTYEEIYGSEGAREEKEKRSTSNTGKIRSNTFKETMSQIKTNHYAELSNEEKFNKLRPWIEAGMKSSAEKLSDTKIELLVEQMLVDKGLEYNTNYFKQYQIGNCYVDFCIPDKKVVIEVNGCYWHCCEQCGYNQGVRGETAKERRLRDVRRKKIFRVTRLQSH